VLLGGGQQKRIRIHGIKGLAGLRRKGRKGVRVRLAVFAYPLRPLRFSSFLCGLCAAEAPLRETSVVKKTLPGAVLFVVPFRCFVYVEDQHRKHKPPTLPDCCPDVIKL
jgi:hypothetical protein